MAWHLATQDAVCDRAEPVAGGTLIAASAVPTYWHYNALRIERPVHSSAAELAAEADELQAGLEHRRVEVHDEATGARLTRGFGALGWTVERNAWMLQRGPAPARPTQVEQVAGAVVLDLRAEWAGTWPDGPEFIAIEDRAAAALPGHLATLAVFDPWPVGFARLRLDRATAEVTDVYVTPSHRASGLGAALVDGAIATARAEAAGDLWIVAEADGRAAALYARHGFEPVWVAHEFTRAPV